MSRLWVDASIDSAVPEAKVDLSQPHHSVATNVAQLREIAAQHDRSICSYVLEGILLADVTDNGTLFFQDQSGIEILETDIKGNAFKAGQHVRIQGTNCVASTAIGLSLGKYPLVDNDGWHVDRTCLGTVFLRKGIYPIRLVWFNRGAGRVLNLTYSGPEIKRMSVPDYAFFRSDETTDALVNGLNYKLYQFDNATLPPYENSKPIKRGSTSRPDLELATSVSNYVALSFEGFIQITNEGIYTFGLNSDGGSQLILQHGDVQVSGSDIGEVPAARTIVPKQPRMGRATGPFWGETEGIITFLGPTRSGLGIELKAQESYMHVKLLDVSADEWPHYLVGSRVKVRGVVLDTADSQGRKLANAMVVPDRRHIQVINNSLDGWIKGKSITIKEGKSRNWNSTSPVILRGKIRGEKSSAVPILQDSSGSVPVEFLSLKPPTPEDEIECLGSWSGSGSGSVLKDAVWRTVAKPSDNQDDELPLLNTAAEVQAIKPRENERGNRARVHLKGVITWVREDGGTLVLQDDTRGVFMRQSAWIIDSPKVGERLEVKGDCRPGGFAPYVIPREVKRLGMGIMPAPLHPTWDQLLGGSLDCQYVEIRGFVTRVEDKHLELLMSDGRLGIQLNPPPAGLSPSLLHSVIRLRGCMFVRWDPLTHEVLQDRALWFRGCTLNIEQPAATDPFNVDPIRASQFRRYDVRRDFLRQVKVSAQVLCRDGDLYYATDEGYNLRFRLTQPQTFDPGDNVEIAGLVSVGGVSPMMTEAVARKKGHSPLPAATALSMDGTNETTDGSRVWVEGTLVDVKDIGGTRTFELQRGSKTFLARLPLEKEPANSWPVGSRLRLTGVYSSLSPLMQGPAGLNPFELLLSSSADIHLIARPPFWTSTRLLIMLLLLIGALLLIFVWVYQLRLQVERRSIQLEQEISSRERAEKERALELERSRIARDLHDDLGSALTAINMMATTRPAPESSNVHLERLQAIAKRARSMITALDGLVWTIDPQNDTLAALVEYIASYAAEFLAGAEVLCKIERPHHYPDWMVMAEVRHNLLLAVAETLNNSVRHGRPTQVLLRIECSDDRLEIFIKDDGQGFDTSQKSSGYGLSNLEQRMSRINGSCRIESIPQQGTSIWLTVPWASLSR
ncbi:MAG TPA: ATP-binding protein [Verrucomicrobiae bacterium]|nr:ATP-binding protein [Verrucomicrobiae bacterium]